MRHLGSTSIGCIACLCALLAMALAQQPIRAAGDESAQGKAEEWAEEGRNDLGLFLGVTDSDGDSGFSVGLDYERRLSRGFGIGGVIEYTGNDYRYGLVAASCRWHAWKELKLLAAPALNFDFTTYETSVVYGLSFARTF